MKKMWNETRKKTGYRSTLEVKVAKQLQDEGVTFAYESLRVPYTLPAAEKHYCPDFPIPGTNILIEAKGRFDADDRKKLALVKEQHPEWDLRLVFENARGKINPSSKTTLAEWADKHGFKWSQKTIPPGWITEIQIQLTKGKL
jgi:hypothetical protein